MCVSRKTGGSDIPSMNSPLASENAHLSPTVSQNLSRLGEMQKCRCVFWFFNFGTRLKALKADEILANLEPAEDKPVLTKKEKQQLKHDAFIQRMSLHDGTLTLCRASTYVGLMTCA